MGDTVSTRSSATARRTIRNELLQPTSCLAPPKVLYQLILVSACQSSLYNLCEVFPSRNRLIKIPQRLRNG
jgi:hypothetical protein